MSVPYAAYGTPICLLSDCHLRVSKSYSLVFGVNGWMWPNLPMCYLMLTLFQCRHDQVP